MAISTFPAASAASKTRYVVTLLSGTSWTVPAGCLYVNATLFGAGSGAGGSFTGAGPYSGTDSAPGAVITTNVATTPGASITYAIGAGGAGGASGGSGGASSAGGNTTFTGATTANGGAAAGAGVGAAGSAGSGAGNGGGTSALGSGGAGGNGKIELEYWV